MNTTEHTDVTESEDEAPKRLRRSRDKRVAAGVCGGLADYFGLHVAVYRVLFIALTFAGGTGLLLYIAAALVMPAEGADESALEETLRRHRHRPWLVIVFALLALAVVFSLSDAGWHDDGFDPGGIILLVILAGTVFAWTRASRRDARRREATGRRSVRWRVGLAAALLGVLAAIAGTALAAAHEHGGIGDRREQPRDIGELDDEYRLGLGSLELDLTDLQFPRGETRVEATLGAGELKIRLPEDVAVDVTGDVNWGEAELLGRYEDGDDLHERVVDPDFEDAARRLVIDADVGIGELAVTR